MLDLKGCILTPDAMDCQREIAETIIAKGADYILAVKGIRLSCSRISGKPSKDKPQSEDSTTEPGHGRIKKRCCRVFYNTERSCRREEWKGEQAGVLMYLTTAYGYDAVPKTSYFMLVIFGFNC